MAEWTRELERKLTDLFKATLRMGGLVPDRFLPELRAEFETIKVLPTQSDMERMVERLAREIIAREVKPPVVRPPPPPVAPPPRVEEVGIPAAVHLGPRRRRLETFTCWHPECFESVTVDRDLEYRVRLIPVLVMDTPKTGPIFEPLLRFPPRFYFMCPKHRKEKFGYTGIYDALAFQLRETEVGDKLTVTKATLGEIGLDEKDIAEIQREKIKYLPVRGFPPSS